MFYIIDNIWYLCKYMLERIPKCTLKNNEKLRHVWKKLKMDMVR